MKTATQLVKEISEAYDAGADPTSLIQQVQDWVEERENATDLAKSLEIARKARISPETVRMSDILLALENLAKAVKG